MLTDKISNKKTVLLYSVLFIAFMSLCVFLFYAILGKNLFPNYDGITQQYTYFIYTGTWFRRLFTNLFVEHTIELPNWDMSEFGFDPFMMISEIQLLNPLYWLSAFSPKNLTEYVFNAVIVIQYYFAGLSFLYFCFYRKHTGISAVVGALSYVFSGFAFIGLIQANFTVLFILFPLLIVGADKLWDEGKFVFYCLIVAYCTYYSYYFIYMMGIMLIFYCIIKFITEDNKSFKRLLPLIGKFVFFTLIGIGIGIGPSVPGIINLAGIDRLKLTRPFRFTYGFLRTKKLIGGMFSYVDLENEYESNYGITALLIPSLYILWEKRSDYKRTITLALIFFVSLFIPFIGSLMNGFNYSTQRYIFGFILILSYIITIGTEDILKITPKEYIRIFGVTFIYAIISLMTGELYGVMSAISSVITILVLWVLSSKGIKKTQFLFIPLLFSCIVIGFTQSVVIPNSRGIDFGTAFNAVYNNEGMDIIRSYPDTNSVRYDRLCNYYGSFTSNASMTSELYGYDFYHSNYNNNLSNYIDDMGLVSDGVSFCYRNLHGRTLIEILNGTKYISAPNDLTYGVPCAYERDNETESPGIYNSYISCNPVSLVFFYDNTFNEEAYLNLDPASKEELMMNYMITEESAVTHVDNNTFFSQRIPYTIDEIHGMEINGNSILVTEPDAYVTLGIQEQGNNELMLWINNLQLDVTNDPYTQYFQVTPTVLSNGQTVASDAFVSNTANRSVYHIRKDWVFNFNMAEKSCDQILIYFDNIGQYQFDGIEILSRDINDTETIIKSFEDHADLDNISYQIDGTHITIEASTDSVRYLYIAIPYSEGWSAYIDGEQADIIKANRAFMALQLEEGCHNIEFIYHTPYIKEGIGISLGSALALIIIYVIKRGII